MPVHFNPDTTLSNVSEGEYFGCFQKFLVLLVLFLVQLCVKLSTIIFSFIYNYFSVIELILLLVYNVSHSDIDFKFYLSILEPLCS